MYTKPFLFSKFSRHRRPDFKPQLVLNKLVAINHEGWMGGAEQQIQAQQFRPKPKERMQQQTGHTNNSNRTTTYRPNQYSVCSQTLLLLAAFPLFLCFLSSLVHSYLSAEKKSNKCTTQAMLFCPFCLFYLFFGFFLLLQFPLFLQFARSHCNHTSCMSQYC